MIENNIYGKSEGVSAQICKLKMEIKGKKRGKLRKEEAFRVKIQIKRNQ